MNELIIKDDNMLTLIQQERQLDNVTNQIKGLVDGVSKNYIYVGWWLLKAKNLNLNLFEYEDIFDYANKVFGIKKTSVYNMMAVAEKFCNFDGYYSYTPSLKSEFEGFNYSQLVELLSVDNIDVEKYKSLPVAAIKKEKILDKIKSYVGDIVNKHISIIENEIFKDIDEFSLWSFDENDEYACLENLCKLGELKYKKSKPVFQTSDYNVCYEQSYKCYYSKDPNFYFNARYYYDNIGNDAACSELELKFNFDGWQNHFKVMPKLTIDMTKKWNENYEDFTNLFFDTYKYRLTKYEAKKAKELKELESKSIDRKELFDFINEIVLKPSFKYVDYKEQLNKHLKNYLEKLQEFVTIDDSTILCAQGYTTKDSWNCSLYVNVVDEYYIQYSYYSAFNMRLCLHSYDKDHKNYNGNPEPNRFSDVDYTDAALYKLLIEFIKNKYSNN